MRTFFFTIFTLLFFAPSSQAQEDRVDGKVIKNYGATYAVSEPEFTTNLDEPYKVVFDVSDAPEDPSVVNKWVATVARFLNMHAEAGKSLETMDVVMVLHGNASYGLLQDPYYKEKYGVSNPNIELFKALNEAGVDLILCGQTAHHRNLSKERRIAEAKLSLSAMTALIQLQNDNYTLINF